MKFKHLTMHNYGVFHGTHEFPLYNRGLILMMGDNRDEPRMNSNGAGKSTVPDALDWCLWGVVPRGDHVDSIINEEAGKYAMVTVELEDDDGTPITITRTRKAPDSVPKLSLVVGAKDLTALDVDQTQAHIERVLGLDREVFHATVLFGQFDLWNFADATDKERVDLLTKILQLGRIDKWLEGAKEKAMENRLIQENLQRRLSQLQGRIEGLTSVNYDDQIEAWDRQHVQKQNAFRLELEEIGEVPDPKRLEAELATLVSSSRIESPTIPELEKMKVEVSRQQVIMAQAMRHAKKCTDEVTRMRMQQEGVCSECGQTVTADHLAKEVAKKSELAQAAIEEATNEQARMKEFEGWMGNLLNQEYELKRQHREQMDKIQEDIKLKHAYAQQVLQRFNRQQLLQKALHDLGHEVNPFVSEKLKMKDALKSLDADMDKLDGEILKAVTEGQYIDFWVNGFGSKGLKSYILDSRLQEMTDAANDWIRMLTGGTVWIRFETQTKGRSTKKLSNKINIRVFRYNPNGTVSERNYRSWSGGEKQRVSLGIDFGMSRLVAARASKRYDLLILDEVFKHLDQAGREAVVEMLQQLKHEKSSVLVVDHDSEFQGAFENRLVVRKEHGRSQIIEGGHSEEKSRAEVRRRRVPNRTPVRRRQSASDRH